MSNGYDLPYRIINRLKRANDNEDDDYLGSLTYVVYNSKDKSQTKSVLKMVDLEKTSNLSEFIKNILWYKQLNHHNLMSLRDCLLIDTRLYLIKPYASYGSCADLLQIHSFGIREQLIGPIVWQVIQALRYLHERHIMHRAVASKNIYLCDNGRVLLDNFTSCISMISPMDGKLRRQLHDYTDNLKDQILYLAPEVIYQNAAGYNFKSDVYSLGTVACELANGSNTYIDMPFEYLSMLYAKVQGSEPILLDQSQLTDEMIALSDENSSAYVEEIKKRRYTKEFHAFVKSCVSTRLESRCSIDELETHAFLKQAKKLGVDSQVFVDSIGRFFGRCQSEETNHAERTLDQIFSSHAVADSNNQCHSINLAWEF